MNDGLQQPKRKSRGAVRPVRSGRDSTSLKVPVYFVQAAQEARGRAELFREWFRILDAPSKHVIELRTSGHRPLFEQPDELIEYMNNTVLLLPHRPS